MGIVDDMLGLLSAYIAEEGVSSAEKLSVAVGAYRDICESSARLASIGYAIDAKGDVPSVGERPSAEAAVEADSASVAREASSEAPAAPVATASGLVRDGVVVPNADGGTSYDDATVLSETVEVTVPSVDAVEVGGDVAFVPEGEDVLEAMRESDEGDLESEFGRETWSDEPVSGEEVAEDGDVTVPPDEYELSDSSASSDDGGASDGDAYGDISAFDDMEGLDAAVGDDFEDPLMQDLRSFEAPVGGDVPSGGGVSGSVPVDDDEFGIGVTLPSIPTYGLGDSDADDVIF